jgi:hypothetical protein
MILRDHDSPDNRLTGTSDEADVFLEARTSNSDPNRNALVSGISQVGSYPSVGTY